MPYEMGRKDVSVEIWRAWPMQGTPSTLDPPLRDPSQFLRLPWDRLSRGKDKIPQSQSQVRAQSISFEIMCLWVKFGRGSPHVPPVVSLWGDRQCDFVKETWVCVPACCYRILVSCNGVLGKSCNVWSSVSTSVKWCRCLILIPNEMFVNYEVL